MKIVYQGDYGEELFRGETLFPPAPGDQIVFGEEDFVVRNREFYPLEDAVVISVTQNLIRKDVAEDKTTGRLAEMQGAILKVNSRLDKAEKKGKALTEQLITVKTHVNKMIRQEKKE